jgi:MFS transporter, NNP family, nitrate/nitrite transporter
MANLSQAMKSGHWPTLFAAFLYFDFCFSIWVLNGAMGPFLTQSFSLSPAETGLMVSIPTLAGALMRFPLGVLSQYIGRKNAALLEMTLIIVAMLYGWLFVTTFTDELAMGVLLGIAGASFGVALSLGLPESHICGMKCPAFDDAVKSGEAPGNCLGAGRLIPARGISRPTTQPSHNP